MSSESTTARTRVKKQHRFSEQQNAFFFVVTSYAQCREQSHVAASINDDEQPPNRTLAPGSLGLDFCIDTERLTSLALHQEPELQQTWFGLLRGETGLDPGLVRECIRRCGQAYLEAQMDSYFRPSIKRGRGERVTA